MNVLIMGWKRVEYTKRDTGEYKQGVSMYVASQNDDVHGLMTDSIWLDAVRQADLCKQVTALDCTQPVNADLEYTMQLGSRRPVLTAIIV